MFVRAGRAAVGSIQVTVGTGERSCSTSILARSARRERVSASFGTHLSDVRSNIEALDAALALTREDDQLLCLGDIVGYGPNPNECVAKIRTRATATVLGNHDVAAIDNFGLSYFNPAAREAMRWTQRVINAESKEWLNSLGYEFRMPDFLLVHGAPQNYFEYILDKAGAQRAFAATDAPVVFIGHTHIAEYYALETNGSITHKHLQNGGELVLPAGT